MIVDGKWIKNRLIIEKCIKMFTTEEPMDYKELQGQSDQVFLNYVFETYKICRPFLKGMHLTLEYSHPHRESKVWKQVRDGLEGDLTEEKLGSEEE